MSEEQQSQAVTESSQTTPSILNSTASNTIFDAIRAGLKYIDGNDDKVETILDSSTVNASTTEIPISNKQTELSFLDILLGDDDDDDDEYETTVASVENLVLTSTATTTTSTTPLTTPTAIDYLSDLSKKEQWLSTIANVHRNKYPTNDYDITAQYKPISHQQLTHTLFEDENFQRITNRYENSSPHYSPYEGDKSTIDDFLTTNSIDYSTEVTGSTTDYETKSTTDELNSSTDEDSTMEQTSTEEQTDSTSDSSETTEFDTTSEIADISSTESPTESTIFETTSIPSTTTVNTKTDLTTTVPTTTTTATTIHSESYLKDLNELLRHNLPSNETEQKPNRTTAPILNATTTENIFSAFFDGISNIFSEQHNATMNVHPIKRNLTRHRTTTLSPKNTTLKRSTVPPTKSSPPNHTINGGALTTLAVPSYEKPILIDSNPSILESDLNYDYGEPTLPPSLPNLKIIPFLPTDAVKNNRNNVNYFKIKSTSDYPVLTENYDSLYLTQEKKPSLDILAYTTEDKDYLKESKTSNHNDFELFNLHSSAIPPPDAFNRNNGNIDFSSYGGSDTTGFPNEKIYQLPPPSGDNLDYDGYDHTSYPSITEHYEDASAFADGEKNHYSAFSKYDGTSSHEYPTYGSYNVPLDEKHQVDQFNTNGAVNDVVKFSHAGFDGESGENSYGIVTSYEKFATIYPEKQVYSKLEFSTTNPAFGFERNNNKFSPPSKTEGL